MSFSFKTKTKWINKSYFRIVGHHVFSHLFLFDHRLQDTFWARPLKTTPDAKLTVTACALKRLPDAPRRLLRSVWTLLYVLLRSWRNALRQQQFSVTEWRFQVVKVRQRFLVCSKDFLTVVLCFGFQTTIIIVGQLFPANPIGEWEADGL